MSRISRSMSCNSWSLNRSPSRPAVSIAVCSPSALQRRKICVTNAFCTIGSPPESVTPPLILRTLAYLPIWRIARETGTGWPLCLCQVSGLWQNLQRSGQPVRNATKRMPGPSTVVPTSYECTKPTTSSLLAGFLLVARIDRQVIVDRLAFSRAFARDVQLVAAADQRLVHGAPYIEPWKVRFITSSCCSFVSLTKLTAYPDTRTVSCGYFSGCFIASASVSRFSTLMLTWKPPLEK